MSRTAKVNLFFGDDFHDFRLGVGELEELEVATRRVARQFANGDIEFGYIGPAHLHDLLGKGEALTKDVRETLRIGLIGGGMKPAEAFRLVQRYFSDLPDFLENARIAWAVLAAALKGYEVESLGESQEAEGQTKPETTEQDGFLSPLSMQTPQ